ncbi:thioredoxin-domain-containing protein [Clavulina sp. PMI_390]|nr:thioredoxin-domain-containing protein [Clavulina sp. PMI_390]
MSITQLHSLSDLSKVNEKSNGKLVVIDFNATWCGPCHMIAPKYQEFSRKYTDATFTEVDVDKAQDVARKYGVTAMPTFVFLKNGQQIDSVRGANPMALEKAIQKGIAAGPGAAEAFAGKGRTLGGGEVGGPGLGLGALFGADQQTQILLLLVGLYLGYVSFFA